jgi:hypothetical protein
MGHKHRRRSNRGKDRIKISQQKTIDALVCTYNHLVDFLNCSLEKIILNDIYVAPWSREQWKLTIVSLIESLKNIYVVLRSKCPMIDLLNPSIELRLIHYIYDDYLDSSSDEEHTYGCSCQDCRFAYGETSDLD